MRQPAATWPGGAWQTPAGSNHAGIAKGAGANLSLRADRVVALARVEGEGERPPHIPMAQWLDVVERDR